MQTYTKLLIITFQMSALLCFATFCHVQAFASNSLDKPDLFSSKSTKFDPLDLRNSQELDDHLNNQENPIDKRAQWNNLQGGWGKRAEWNKLSTAWGKRPSGGTAGWNNLSGMWGKRATKWNGLSGMWGKRGWNDMSAAWGKRESPHWNKLRGMWGKRSEFVGNQFGIGNE